MSLWDQIQSGKINLPEGEESSGPEPYDSSPYVGRTLASDMRRIYRSESKKAKTKWHPVAIDLWVERQVCRSCRREDLIPLEPKPKMRHEHEDEQGKLTRRWTDIPDSLQALASRLPHHIKEIGKPQHIETCTECFRSLMEEAEQSEPTAQSKQEAQSLGQLLSGGNHDRSETEPQHSTDEVQPQDQRRSAEG